MTSPRNLAEAASAAPIDPFVAYAPAGSEARFEGVLHPGTRLILADGDGEMPSGVAGFGRCLLQATARLLDMGYSAACVLNADSPTLPTAFLVQAAEALLRPGRRAVLGPAEDGGYYLLGMQALEPALYADITWSSDVVAEQTRARAASADLAMDLLPPWYDVDDHAALLRLLREIDEPGQLAYGAPATASCVAELGLVSQIAA